MLCQCLGPEVVVVARIPGMQQGVEIIRLASRGFYRLSDPGFGVVNF